MQVFGQKTGSIDIEDINNKLNSFLKGSIFISQTVSMGDAPVMGGLQPQGKEQGGNTTYSLSTPLLDFVLDYFPNPSRYFDQNSIIKLQQLRDLLANAISQQKQSIVNQWQAANPNFSLEFRDDSAFFRLYSDISPYMNEEAKLSTLAFWAKNLEQYYDKGKSNSLEKLALNGFYSLSARKMIKKYSQETPLGICADINGSFLKEFAKSFGIKHSSVSVWNPESSTAHMVAMLQTGEGNFYQMSYGNYSKVGDMKSPQIAAERLLSYFGGYKPFAFNYDKQNRFFNTHSDEILKDATNWAKRKIEDEFSISLLYKQDGSFAARSQKNIENFNFGAFFLNTPFSLQNSFGAYMNFRSKEKKGSKAKEGFVWLPSLDLAVFSGGAAPGTMMFGISALEFRWLPTKNIEFDITPLKIEGAWGGRKRIDLFPSSTAGFIYKMDRFSQIYSSIDFGYCPNQERFYEFYSPEVAYRATAGLRAKNTQIEARYMPQGMLSKAEIDAKQNFQIYGGLNLAIFASVKYANSPSYGFGGVFSYKF